MRTSWVTTLTAGVLLFLISLAADSLGIGEGTGFGWKQITGAILGVIMAGVGMSRLRRISGS